MADHELVIDLRPYGLWGDGVDLCHASWAEFHVASGTFHTMKRHPLLTIH